jgi:hypothetical protein
MKIILISIMSIAALSLTACKKPYPADKMPHCVEQKIIEISNQPVRNPAAQVWKWEDNQNTYYYITSDCCDQFNLLYNENCDVVCAPDGGITGGGDGNCPNFQGQLVKTLVWEDPRQ